MKKDRLALIAPMINFIHNHADDIGIALNAQFIVVDKLKDMENIIFFARYEKAFLDFYLSRFQHADNFRAELFRLFYKADVRNQFNFFQGFPIEMLVFQAWRENGSDADFFKEFINK